MADPSWIWALTTAVVLLTFLGNPLAREKLAIDDPMIVQDARHIDKENIGLVADPINKEANPNRHTNLRSAEGIRLPMVAVLRL